MEILNQRLSLKIKPDLMVLMKRSLVVDGYENLRKNGAVRKPIDC
jgi:hypothetical protein